MSQEFGEQTISEFMSSISAGQPTPGGGGVAAFAGALAAALAEMVANLTAGRRKYRAVEEQAQAVRQRAVELQADLQQAVVDDAYVYQRVITILQHRTANNDQALLQSIEDALVGAAQVPLNVARMCQEVVDLAADMVEFGNEHAVADAAAAAYLARAAVQVSLLNVKANLREVGNAKLKRSWINQVTRIDKSVGEKVVDIAMKAESRIDALGQPGNPRRRKRRRKADSDDGDSGMPNIDSNDNISA